ncbi:MAG: metallophosphoesterase family protein [Phycisphaerales bacterium]|nr:metallophosphoesterase family protein [Phycisphaerales bacterium]
MPTTFAIISDIHANLEALQAVLADIDGRGITEWYCLGDVIGYGASPKECLDLVIERSKATLCGNHDQAVFFEPCSFNISAERAAYWTRRTFEEESNRALRNRRWEALGRLPCRFETHGLLLVHASPRRPINEYLFAEDVYTNPTKILANFERLEPHHMTCMVGHTHVPGVFLDDPYFDPPGELPETNRYVITDDEKAIINVGSVGQPRDRDVRASYVVVTVDDGQAQSGYRATVDFVRVEYDVEKAVKKILAVPDLDDFLGTRLLDGR